MKATTADGHSDPWFIISRIIAVLTLMMCGIVGNSIILRIYTKDKKLTGSVYIITLAIIDMFYCCVLIPQAPLREMAAFMDMGVIRFLIDVQGSAVCMTYAFVQLAMAFDQFIAVLFPFKHKDFRQKSNKIVLSLALIVVPTHVTLLAIHTEISNQLAGVPFPVIVSTILIIYSATTIKLYKQNRTIRPQAHGAQVTKGYTTDTQNARRTDATTQRAHNNESRPTERADDVRNNSVRAEHTNDANQAGRTTESRPTEIANDANQAGRTTESRPTEIANDANQAGRTTDGRPKENVTDVQHAEAIRDNLPLKNTSGQAKTGHDSSTEKAGQSRNAPPTAATGTQEKRDNSQRAGKPQQQRQDKRASQRKAMHIQAFKIYTAIFGLCACSYGVLIAIFLTEQWTLIYVYSINHIGNSVIYWLFVEKFRNSVKNYLKALKLCACK